jgi:hypothetical protein
VFARRLRTLLAAASAVAIVGAMSLPREHRHSTDVDDAHDHDRAASVVHRHFAPHATPADDHEAVGDADGEAEWLADPHYLKVESSDTPIPVTVAAVLPAPVARRLTSTPGIAPPRPSTHDPPRSVPGLRAPPPFETL